MLATESSITGLVKRVNHLVDQGSLKNDDAEHVLRDPAFEEFLAKTGQGIAISSTEGYFYYVSNSLANILGYTVPWMYQKGPAFFQHVIIPSNKSMVEKITTECEQLVRKHPNHRETFRISFDYNIISGWGQQKRIYQHTLPGAVVQGGKMYTLFILMDLSGFKKSPILNYTVAVMTNEDSFNTIGQGTVKPQAPYQLTRRETVIVNCLAQGMKSDEISNKLFISEITLRAHRRNILKKTGAKNMVEIISTGLKNGWISSVPEHGVNKRS